MATCAIMSWQLKREPAREASWWCCCVRRCARLAHGPLKWESVTAKQVGGAVVSDTAPEGTRTRDCRCSHQRRSIVNSSTSRHITKHKRVRGWGTP